MKLGKLGWQDLNLQNVTSLRLSYGSSVKHMLVVEMSNYNGNSNVQHVTTKPPLCQTVQQVSFENLSYPGFEAHGLHIRWLLVCANQIREKFSEWSRVWKKRRSVALKKPMTQTVVGNTSPLLPTQFLLLISFTNIFCKPLLFSSFENLFFVEKSINWDDKDPPLLDLNWEEIEVALGKPSNSATYHLQIARHAAG